MFYFYRMQYYKNGTRKPVLLNIYIYIYIYIYKNRCCQYGCIHLEICLAKGITTKIKRLYNACMHVAKPICKTSSLCSRQMGPWSCSVFTVMDDATDGGKRGWPLMHTIGTTLQIKSYSVWSDMSLKQFIVSALFLDSEDEPTARPLRWEAGRRSLLR